MESAVWALIALLAATIVGNTFYLGSRIDAQAARIDALFALMGELREEMGNLRTEMGTLRTEMGTLRREVSEVRGLIEGHVERHAG